MGRKRFSPKDFIGKLPEARVRLALGQTIGVIRLEVRHLTSGQPPALLNDLSFDGGTVDGAKVQ